MQRPFKCTHTVFGRNVQPLTTTAYVETLEHAKLWCNIDSERTAIVCDLTRYNMGILTVQDMRNTFTVDGELRGEVVYSESYRYDN